MNGMLLPLQGALTHITKPQGVALGYTLLPLRGAIAKNKNINFWI